MSDKVKHITDMSSQAGSKQSGFVILMGLLVLVLGAAAWYGSIGGKKSASMKAGTQGEYVANLQHVKERMLTYATLTPELFDSGPADMLVPGPGYFPCPDITGDEISDTVANCSRANSLYGIGWVPPKILNRNFSFLSTNQMIENKRYWFAVDTRFLVDGWRFRIGFNPGRFAPLNINTPSLVDTTGASLCDETVGNPITATCVPPLTLDGEDDIVMVLFYAGIALGSDQQRQIDTGAARFRMRHYLEQPSMIVPASLNGLASLTGAFISRGNGVDPFNDYVISITREEWNAAMLSRVAKDANIDGVPDLCETPLNIEINDKDSWFDDCRYLGGIPPYPCTNIASLAGMPVANIEGQGWREALGCL